MEPAWRARRKAEPARVTRQGVGTVQADPATPHCAGRPSPPHPGSHQGLIGLKERTELLNGTLESGPTVQGGYDVRLRIPRHTD